MAGLWKGLGPNIARNAIINAAELASYDQIKVSLLETGAAAGLGRMAGGGGWQGWQVTERERGRDGGRQRGGKEAIREQGTI